MGCGCNKGNNEIHNVVNKQPSQNVSLIIDNM